MTSIYSAYPPTHESVSSCLDTCRQSRRKGVCYEDYPALPWTLEELAGSEWRNVFTATLKRVERLMPNRWGQLVAYDPEMLADWDGIGFWWGDKGYCINCYVRVDHLAPEVQLDWFLQEVLLRLSSWEQDKAHARVQGDRIRQRGKGKEAIEPEEVRSARLLMKSFAQSHNLVVNDLPCEQLLPSNRSSCPQS